jgi:uncharacterized protein YbaR (Trm112 family)
MAELVHCPVCSRALEVSDELRGQELRCPACDTTFLPGAKPEPSTEPEAAGPPARRRVRRDAAGEAEPCPNCGAGIPADVLRCPSCQAELEFEDDRPWADGRVVARDAEPHRGSLVLTLGILSIVLPFFCCPPLGLAMGVVGWIMGLSDLRKMRANAMDREGYGTTQAGFVCGIIGTVIGGLMTLLMIAYFIFVIALMRVTVQQAQAAAAQQAAKGQAGGVGPVVIPPGPELPREPPPEPLPMPAVHPLDQ